MTRNAYLLYLGLRLSSVNERIRKAERRLAIGDLRDRVHAAGDLVVLRRRKKRVEGKIHKMQVSRGGPPEGLCAEIAGDLDAIGIAFDRLVSRT